MAFWSNWPDGTKWLMGIIGALIVAALVAHLNSYKSIGSELRDDTEATAKAERPRDEEFARLQRRMAELEAKEEARPRDPNLRPSEPILEEGSDGGTPKQQDITSPEGKQVTTEKRVLRPVEHALQDAPPPQTITGSANREDRSVNQAGSESSYPEQNQAAPELRSAAPMQQVQNVNVSTQNEFVRVEVLTIAIPKSRDRLTLSVKLENTSGEDLPIAIAKTGGEYFGRAYIVDELGTTTPKSPARDSVSIPGFPALWSSSDPNDYVRLSPGETIEIKVIFSTSLGFTGTNFTFSAQFVGLVRGNATPIRISIPGINFSHQSLSREGA